MTRPNAKKGKTENKTNIDQRDLSRQGTSKWSKSPFTEGVVVLLS
jgi:hypothetical protein